MTGLTERRALWFCTVACVWGILPLSIFSHMSETPLDLLVLEWLCNSLDVWKYKGENGCQVLLLLISWEMQSSPRLGVVCVLTFLILLLIPHLKIWEPINILRQKEQILQPLNNPNSIYIQVPVILMLGRNVGPILLMLQLWAPYLSVMASKSHPCAFRWLFNRLMLSVVFLLLLFNVYKQISENSQCDFSYTFFFFATGG